MLAHTHLQFEHNSKMKQLCWYDDPFYTTSSVWSLFVIFWVDHQYSCYL